MVKKDENFYYLCYVLGYDLLHNKLMEQEFTDCDTTFEFCKIVVSQFLESEENKNINKSQYDCLVEFIENKLAKKGE